MPQTPEVTPPAPREPMGRAVISDAERCEARVSLDECGKREDHPDRGTANEGRCFRRAKFGTLCTQHAKKLDPHVAELYAEVSRVIPLYRAPRGTES